MSWHGISVSKSPEVIKAREQDLPEGLIQDLERNLTTALAGFLHTHASCELSVKELELVRVPSADGDVTEFPCVIACINTSCVLPGKLVEASYTTVSGLP